MASTWIEDKLSEQVFGLNEVVRVFTTSPTLGYSALVRASDIYYWVDMTPNGMVTEMKGI